MFEKKKTDTSKKSNAYVSLQDAQFVEETIADFIQKRDKTEITTPMPSFQPTELEPFLISQDFKSEEIDALRKGEYRTSNAYTNLSSAKSLINRYAMGVPMVSFDLKHEYKVI